MSVSGVSGYGLSSLDSTDQDSKFKKVKSDFDALATALKSGDLSAAKTAYTQVQQDLKNAPTSSQNSQGSSAQTSPADALKAIGDALNSGDIASAQKAFATLQSQGGQRTHHHHHHAQAATTTTTDTSSTEGTQSTTGIDLTA